MEKAQEAESSRTSTEELAKWLRNEAEWRYHVMNKDDVRREEVRTNMYKAAELLEKMKDRLADISELAFAAVLGNDLYPIKKGR